MIKQYFTYGHENNSNDQKNSSNDKKVVQMSKTHRYTRIQIGNADCKVENCTTPCTS